MTLLFTNRRVLLTGAGGSIGSALARQLIKQKPESLILLDHSEGNLFQIDFELASLPGAQARRALVGDICDAALLAELFEEQKPEIVIHAAAYKHVPLMEHNALAAVRNNALGTNLLAKMAQAYGVATFVMVSTDKAANPSSIMGASKRIAELAVLRWSSTESRMIAVRLGNVLGSQGSVVPIFQEQIAAGGPVTVTDPEASRYFVSMDEAVELVLLAANLIEQSGLFISGPDEPVRILDLAKQMIREAGVRADGEIPIVLTGLRPGEKMSEEFVSQRETVESAREARLRKIDGPQPSHDEFDRAIAKLKELVEHRDLEGVLEWVRRLVPEYRPSQAILGFPAQARPSSQ
jgi:FlaA1/EpsC-like NDP-sugar epimerase